MDTLPPLQRGKGIFVNLTLDGICRLHLSGGHAKISLRIYEEAARWGDKDRSAAPKKAGDAMEKRQKTSLTMCLVAIGIVYGDIGTSPLYVMKSILEGNGGITQINESFIVGALSLIIWTITLLTTIKYVLIAMKADNHGEGGIFSLYSLVRSCGKWLIVPAMLGGAALLAVQHAGTSRIGKAFGPVMLVWFLFLGATGAMNIFSMPQVLRAFNPAHAVELLVSPYNKLGFMILGSVFLAATGAEALYSDMGHVGRESIYISWPLVKICLILNYLGQGAWLLSSRGDAALASLESLNPFFLMLPGALRPVAVILSALAAVIASQALITGSYTLVSEAIRLDLMPHLKVQYPAETKGQIYIDTVNKILWVGCTFIVLLFRSSARMESSYGLAITVTMLMTTLLLFVYLSRVRGKKALAWGVRIVCGAIETVFFLSSLSKFAHGGYVAVVMALLLLSIMIIWHRGTQLEQKYSVRLKLGDYTENLAALRGDSALPELTQNLVYIGSSDDMETIDRNTLYSILDKDPKRARAYWFLSVHVLDEPNAMNYQVETFGTDYIFRVKLNLGFKNDQRVNIYLRQIVRDLLESGELPPQERKYSIYGPSQVGSFKFLMLHRAVPLMSELSRTDEIILNLKYAVRRAAGAAIQWYGLDTSSVIVEQAPLVIPSAHENEKRIQRAK